MDLLRVRSVLPGGESGKRRWRRARRYLRCTLAVVSPVVTLVGGLAVPGTVVLSGAAVLTAASAVNASPAKAASLGSVLVLLQNGETTAPWRTVVSGAVEIGRASCRERV